MRPSTETKRAGTSVKRNEERCSRTCSGGFGEVAWKGKGPRWDKACISGGSEVSLLLISTQLLSSKAPVESWVYRMLHLHPSCLIQISWVHLLIFSSSPTILSIASWNTVIVKTWQSWQQNLRSWTSWLPTQMSLSPRKMLKLEIGARGV